MPNIALAAFAAFLLLGAAPQAATADEVLVVTTTGNGSGYVTSSPSGIDCGRNDPPRVDCSEIFPTGASVTLTAHTGARFLGFSGACTTPVDIRQCTVSMDAARSVTAEFGKYDPALDVLTNSIYLGSPLSSMATIQGGLWPKQGTVDFRLYGPDDATCAGTPIFTSQATVNSTDQTYHSGSFTSTQPGVYRWTASYSGDAGNNPASANCNSPGSVATVNKAVALVFSTGSDTTIGGTISNVANLTGQGPTGTIEMRLYPPSDPTCSGTPVYLEQVHVTGSGNYTSGSYTPTQVGTYRWVSAYSGDANNTSASSSCGSAGARSVVSAQAVDLSISATDATVGSAIQATATLAQGQSPTGQMTFSLYGADDPDCAAAPIETSVATVSGNGQYSSNGIFPSHAGTYRWTASYSGDGNNGAATTFCTDAGGVSTLARATPVLSPPSPASVTIGSPLPAQSTLSSGFAPTGELTFTAYGPGDATCSGPAAFSAMVPITGNGAHGTGAFTPAAAGTYRWIVSYPGDADNDPASTTCSAPSTVAQQTPAIAISATGSTVGQAVTATATVSGGHSPTGTVAFAAFAPGDASCSGDPVFTASLAVTGNGEYGSGDFVAPGAGTYRWTASYSGDGDNQAVSSPCGAEGSTSEVAEADPAVSVLGSDAGIGSAIRGTASLSGGVEPEGELTFRAFGPDRPDCSGEPAFSATVEVDGNGEYESGGFTAGSAGNYLWTVEYSGDADNEPAASGCGAEGSSSAVAKASPTLAPGASGDVRLGEPVSASATMAGGHSPGGEITFRLFGPGDAGCSAEPVFTAASPVSGDGGYASPQFTPAETGTYRWLASYSGDGNNRPVQGDCASTGIDVTVAPLTCPAVDLRAVRYRPARVADRGMTLGVRVRILVSRASDLDLTARLAYSARGKRRSVSLGSFELGNPSARNVRLALPARLRGKLPHGSRVSLSLEATATPREPRGCTSPPTTAHRVKTRVVRVLRSKVL